MFSSKIFIVWILIGELWYILLIFFNVIWGRGSVCFCFFLVFLFACGYLVLSTICWKDYSFSTVWSWQFCYLYDDIISHRGSSYVFLFNLVVFIDTTHIIKENWIYHSFMDLLPVPQFYSIHPEMLLMLVLHWFLTWQLCKICSFFCKIILAILYILETAYQFLQRSQRRFNRGMSWIFRSV